jgi:hypothetical protein
MFMKRISLLLILLAACQPTSTPSPVGPTGPTGPTTLAKDPTVCDGGTSTCTKWLSACKKDCKVIMDSARRATCTEGCDDALDSCVAECKASSDPATFDAKTADWDDKPEPPTPESDTCGGVDQECCDEAPYPACQDGLVKTQGNDGQGGTFCGCTATCTKNLLDQKNQGKDDCDNDHICIAQDPSKAPSSTNKLNCVPSLCDPSKASGTGTSLDEGCGYPSPRCSQLFPTKTWGLCQPHCAPHSSMLSCPAGQLCYATYGMAGQQIVPLNVCAAKSGNVADGAACTFTLGGNVSSGFTATENCGADKYCDLTEAAGASRKCRTACGVQDPTNGQVGADNGACSAATQKECSRFLSNITGIPAPSGQNPAAWNQQLTDVAEDQGAMFYCKDTP